MESRILKYLDKVYKAKSYNNQITERWDNNARVYADELVKELTQMFDINYGLAGEFIEVWVKSVAPAFNVKKYWEEKKPWGGMDVTAVMAQTLAQELVAVEPLATPKGILHYLDYQYNDNQVGDYKITHARDLPSLYGPQGVTIKYDAMVPFMSGLTMI